MEIICFEWVRQVSMVSQTNIRNHLQGLARWQKYKKGVGAPGISGQGAASLPGLLSTSVRRRRVIICKGDERVRGAPLFPR